MLVLQRVGDRLGPVVVGHGLVDAAGDGLRERQRPQCQDQLVVSSHGLHERQRALRRRQCLVGLQQGDAGSADHEPSVRLAVLGRGLRDLLAEFDGLLRQLGGGVPVSRAPEQVDQRLGEETGGLAVLVAGILEQHRGLLGRLLSLVKLPAHELHLRNCVVDGRLAHLVGGALEEFQRLRGHLQSLLHGLGLLSLVNLLGIQVQPRQHVQAGRLTLGIRGRAVLLQRVLGCLFGLVVLALRVAQLRLGEQSGSLSGRIASALVLCEAGLCHLHGRGILLLNRTDLNGVLPLAAARGRATGGLLLEVGDLVDVEHRCRCLGSRGCRRCN
mmetsp:Transcript_77595/g.240414  ORF Transcript_77595/g.240414 Transcript_77595/m.240414 type:complete len:328 (-) Transcript_77595:17-1000(-)